ncbi:rop guanine nucleotide exchange factor 14-like isoform X1 [Cucurbita pepo subsp. pepo]|uniref:rop guanine nucleotide exchange factor 14-like isoform X1 n=1 Tax=Cucurbita pepo subsp. pepo TaxID=3664 RepID=UPI000C9D3915|nr:rop guanine nucleotide exchange factor 14-like isoform X1 [Cucurbita pepo subsp. pepo]XP_023536563.1 rop guanine nucleotide exchange factor 14-like isoform X1 [Cucurbita pepo subsp. pepo]
MMSMRRSLACCTRDRGVSLACCTRDRGVSLDMDEQERIMTFNGLESCVLNNQTYENESGSGTTDSLEDHDSSCSSSKDACGSFSSKWLAMPRDEQDLDEWELAESPQQLYMKEKHDHTVQDSDVEAMKEKFTKLLLGEDVTGGQKGLSSALSLSNAINNLAASVFGELWKLEPLPEERKSKWRREMDWLLSPTHYMVELVPTKQNGTSGRVMEIMIPKVRGDVHVNLPALQKLDSILIGTLDSMAKTEFWYAEVGSRAEGRSKSMDQSMRWWLPLPQVPSTGLSENERKKLLNHGRVVHQVFKAAKSINESILCQMPVPTVIREAVRASGKANLSEELYKILISESGPAENMLNQLNLESDHGVLEAINRLEAAIFTLKEKYTEQSGNKSPVRTSWPFVKDKMAGMDKSKLLTCRAEILLQLLKSKYPNHPQTFLDISKIQYGKDVGHLILEAYSRVLGNLAYIILSRIADVLQEDVMCNNPNSPAPCCFPGMSLLNNCRDQMSALHAWQPLLGHPNSRPNMTFSASKVRGNSPTASPSRNRTSWCMGREVCRSVSSGNNSP